MPSLGPISRKNLIYYLRRCGFEGLYSGGKHDFMRKGKLQVRIPNPHSSDISVKLLNILLKEAGIEKSEWEVL